jgi:hypothetical protein
MKERDHFEDLGEDVWIIFKCIEKKRGGRVLIGLIWLIWNKLLVLVNTVMNLRVPYKRGIS